MSRAIADFSGPHADRDLARIARRQGLKAAEIHRQTKIRGRLANHFVVADREVRLARIGDRNRLRVAQSPRDFVAIIQRKRRNRDDGKQAIPLNRNRKRGNSVEGNEKQRVRRAIPVQKIGIWRE
ncbi:MAG: hypothetical protein K8R69_04680 [Deltaproteobacteria bacterium]|nr:hypothetical protein [Deltaproteobacteria bacterium]